MKFLDLSLILVLVLIGCNDTPNEVIKYQTTDCEDQGFVNVQEWRKEVLAIDSMTINGTLPIISTIERYERELGESYSSYSVISEDISLYGKDPDAKDRYLFKNVIVDKWHEESIVNMIDFRGSDITVFHPRIILKEGTPVRDVCNLYPRSCRLIPSNGNQWSGFIELKASRAGLDFRRVFLIFQREKLIKLRIINFAIM